MTEAILTCLCLRKQSTDPLHSALVHRFLHVIVLLGFFSDDPTERTINLIAISSIMLS